MLPLRKRASYIPEEPINLPDRRHPSGADFPHFSTAFCHSISGSYHSGADLHARSSSSPPHLADNGTIGDTPPLDRFTMPPPYVAFLTLGPLPGLGILHLAPLEGFTECHLHGAVTGTYLTNVLIRQRQLSPLGSCSSRPATPKREKPVAVEIRLSVLHPWVGLDG